MRDTRESDSTVRFRLAGEADRARLVTIVNTAFSVETFLDGTRTDEARLSAMMQKGEILMAEDGNGEAMASVYVEVRGRRGYLGMLAVAPGCQRTGLARRIVAAAEDRLRQKGCEGIDITVLSLRPELPLIYERFGYVRTGTEEPRLSQRLKAGAECHCIAMSKQL